MQQLEVYTPNLEHLKLNLSKILFTFLPVRYGRIESN